MRLLLFILLLSFGGCAADLGLRTSAEGATEAGPGIPAVDGGLEDAGPLRFDGGLSEQPDQGVGAVEPSPFARFDGGFHLDDRSDQHPCAQLCRRPQRSVCGLNFLEDEDDCVATCVGRLSQMVPAAQQAWLRCGLERCQADEPVDCHPAHFMGPENSQACLNAALQRQRCEPDRYEPLWRDAWECESLRSPSDQQDLGGSAMVSCLGEQEACGFAGFYQCLVATRDGLQRREEIRRACAQAERCGVEHGGQCLMTLVGLTPATGGQRVLEVGRCLERARGHCPDIERCLSNRRGLAHALPQQDPCREACGTCVEGADRCVEQCMALRLSLSERQSLDFGRCLGASRCGEAWPLEHCLQRVLPEVVADCRDFEASLMTHCRGAGSDAFAHSPQERSVQCALSGLRSGMMTGEQLERCIQRVGCVDDPVSRCLRGGAH